MQRGTRHTPEARERIRQANLGLKQSDETKAKKSKSLKASWAAKKKTA